MLTDRSKRLVAVTLVAAFIFMAVSPGLSVAVDIPSDLNVGPYVDTLVYKVINTQDQRIHALQSGEIQMDSTFFDPVYLEELGNDPDIDVFTALRNGYAHITINCRDAPLNESVLRRAFAFAFDKTSVKIDVMDGFSQDHDSLVPYPSGWCVEDEFTYHYYADQSDYGNELLNASEKFPYDAEGVYRTYKNVPFDIAIEYSADSPEIAGATAQIGVDALRRLDINAHTQPSDFNELLTRLDFHENYDMIFYASNFYSNDVDWLAYEFWSEYADTDYQNPTNFKNDSYDALRDQLLYGATYEEIFNASRQMQEILQYNVPRLVVYENQYLQGYRNDQFTGHVEDLGRYIAGPWTMRKIHKLDGTFGGTVPIAIPEVPDSFNIYVANSAYSIAILDELWPSLYSYSPNLTPYPDIAVSYISETHSDNNAVQDGHQRFTINIIQNATWSDGEPLTATDVAFSFTYAYESYLLSGNPAGTYIGDLVSAYAKTPSQVVIEFNTESYWHFNNFAFNAIIPEHIFNDETGIGFAGWNTWDPVIGEDAGEPNVNCGPFVISDFQRFDFYELTWNPLYHYAPERPPTSETQSTFNPTLVLVAGAVGAAVVILVGGFILLRQK